LDFLMAKPHIQANFVHVLQDVLVWHPKWLAPLAAKKSTCSKRDGRDPTGVADHVSGDW